MKDENRPKHRVIFELLRRQISEGKFSDRRRLPSEMEIADRFGVSRPTAARALRDLQTLGLLDRRPGSGTYLRESSPSPQKVYGLLVPGLGNTEILDPICNDILKFSQANQANLLWGDGVVAGSSVEEAMRICQYYIEQQVAGVFFAPLEITDDREVVNLQIINQLRAANIAVVLLDRDAVEYPGRSKFDLVAIDNFGAGVMLVKHLIESGNRRFTFFARFNAPSTTDLRIAGCREAMTRMGITPAKNWIQYGDPGNPVTVKNLLGKNLPDVILCSNDRTAAELIQSLTRQGVRVPADVGVAGFDDVQYATLLASPLTTMRQPCREIAQAAVVAMQERVSMPTLHPRQILLTADLVIRQSCRQQLA